MEAKLSMPESQTDLKVLMLADFSGYCILAQNQKPDELALQPKINAYIQRITRSTVGDQHVVYIDNKI